ncbi:hypothetical protein TSMEX_010549 [Taenia solium]
MLQKRDSTIAEGYKRGWIWFSEYLLTHCSIKKGNNTKMLHDSTGSNSDNRLPRSRSDGAAAKPPGEQDTLQRASTLATVQQPVIQGQMQIDDSKVNPFYNVSTEGSSIHQSQTPEASPTSGSDFN